MIITREQEKKGREKFLYLFADEIVGEIVIFHRDCFSITSNVPFSSFVNVLANKQFGPEMGQISPLQLLKQDPPIFFIPSRFQTKRGRRR